MEYIHKELPVKEDSEHMPQHKRLFCMRSETVQIVFDNFLGKKKSSTMNPENHTETIK